jgi:hypothetical protein
MAWNSAWSAVVNRLSLKKDGYNRRSHTRCVQPAALSRCPMLTRRIATLVSAVLHPLLTPALAFLLLIGVQYDLSWGRRLLLLAVA